jgi:4-amino-4-deoxy-L-arabinose transferase-like glycosyltransferase
MEERVASQSAETGSIKRDLLPLLLLLVLALAMRLWQVWHTEVAARDGIGYIRYAWQLQHQPWRDVFRHKDRGGPAYPLALLAVSYPVRHLIHGPESTVMVLSAQLVSAIAGVLLVIPMYYLGGEIFDRRVAFWACLLFQFLPATGRILSDALTEATYLLFAASALWLGARSLRTRSAIGFGISGLCAGLAYLTRPEGGVIVAATGLALLGCQAVRAWRISLGRLSACALTLSVGFLLVAAPFMAVIGRISNKDTLDHFQRGAWLNDTERIVPSARITDASPTTELGYGPPLAVWWQGEDPEHPHRFWWGLEALGTELSKGMFQIGWLPALIALWWFRDRFRSVPGVWILLLVCMAMLLALWRLAAVMGYVSERHAMLILLCAMFWMAAGICVIGDWLATIMRQFTRTGNRVARLLTDGRSLSVILLLCLTGIALPKSLEPLHANRAGLRQAGEWLAEHADPSDEIKDPYCWSHFYAGWVFNEGRDLQPPPGHPHRRYVVLEHSISEHVRLTELANAKDAERTGTICYRWSGKQGKHRAEVLVYVLP